MGLRNLTFLPMPGELLGFIRHTFAREFQEIGGRVEKQAQALAAVALACSDGLAFAGTVPINRAALEWDRAAPPKNWRALVNTWERLDTVRCWVVLAAFALFVTAGAPR